MLKAIEFKPESPIWAPSFEKGFAVRVRLDSYDLDGWRREINVIPFLVQMRECGIEPFGWDYLRELPNDRYVVCFYFRKAEDALLFKLMV